MTRRGTNLALDRRRRDALATYAENAACEAGKPVQTWVRETWGFKDYEAKHLIRGDASETMWERILKARGPHGGWRVALPVLGAIIGEDVADHFAREKEKVAHERARFAAEESRIAALEDAAIEHRSFDRHRDRPAALPPGSATREPRLEAEGMGLRPSD